MLEIVLKVMAECRQNKSKADVVKEVMAPGPFARVAIWFKMRQEGLRGAEIAEAMAMIKTMGGMEQADAEFFVEQAEEHATMAGQSLFEAVPKK